MTARNDASPLSQDQGLIDPGAVAALLAARHGDPFAVLGMHGGTDSGGDNSGGAPVTVRVLLPGALRVAVVDAADGSEVAELPQIHPDGLFAGALPGRFARFAYRLAAQYPLMTHEFTDAYAFGPILGALDLHLIAEGNHHRLFERLGAHPDVIGGVTGTRFAVWAPNAAAVSLVGDFCGWDGRRLPMRRRVEAGVWEIFVPDVGPGARYKYEIKGPGGELLPLKADPMAFAAELRPATASVVHGLTPFPWTDDAWLAGREAIQSRAAPMSIYEVHLGSWARGEDNRFLSYDELAERLIPYVCDLGFTHIELLPITEHPFDGSWGYQPVGLFAPTSRHGSPDAFKRFVNACHAAGVGVLLDWVPGHFPADAHGLGWFDGTALYEHADPRQGFHPDWNTLVYNFGRREVANFLLANALFWLEEYHLDGLRVDAVASMLYLDYSRKEGEWIPNIYGGRENLDAIAFLQRMNALAYGEHRGAVTVAEESTAWPGVSRPAYLGGLGFGYKWNMGWMHDTLNYMCKDPVHRRWRHHDMSFSLLYQYTENFVLPLSHDEVVHGKGSLINKMSGDDWRKFANLRAYLAYMFAHPGKKLLFMGGEIAQWREWSEAGSLDWPLLDYPRHAGVRDLVRELNRLYRSLPALHRLDCEPGGFAWIEADDADNSAYSFARFAGAGDAPADACVVAICHFTPVPRPDYRIGVPGPGRYVVQLNTDDARYGGTGDYPLDAVTATATPRHGRDWSISLTLPPLATLLLLRDESM